MLLLTGHSQGFTDQASADQIREEHLLHTLRCRDVMQGACWLYTSRCPMRPRGSDRVCSPKRVTIRTLEDRNLREATRSHQT
ncbi:hypothetical protein O3P69_002061 [Scylla paramamosain]|uniref:Uncharacterized protein n=2 Tax=Scylla paramamosain TaxID=85552 RepID=A0AAW0V5W9_SCYPA